MVPLDVLIVHQFLLAGLLPFAYLLLTGLFFIFQDGPLLDNHGFFGQLVRVQLVDFIMAWEGLGAHLVDHAPSEVVFSCRLPS